MTVLACSSFAWTVPLWKVGTLMSHDGHEVHLPESESLELDVASGAAAYLLGRLRTPRCRNLTCQPYPDYPNTNESFASVLEEWLTCSLADAFTQTLSVYLNVGSASTLTSTNRHILVEISDVRREGNGPSHTLKLIKVDITTGMHHLAKVCTAFGAPVALQVDGSICENLDDMDDLAVSGFHTLITLILWKARVHNVLKPLCDRPANALPAMAEMQIRGGARISWRCICANVLCGERT